MRYADADKVEAALKDNTLDAVVGAGVLKAAAIQGLQYNKDFEVKHTEDIQNVAVILKIDDIQLRKTVIHAVNKQTMIQNQLGGMEQSVSQFFQTSAPYCNVDLTPKFDYDIEKAGLLNCPEAEKLQASPVFIGLFVAVACLAWFGCVFACCLVGNEKKGSPFFTPLMSAEVSDEKQQKTVKAGEVEMA